MSRSDREAILAAVRRGAPHRQPHPGAHRAPALGSGFESFATSLAEAGGLAHGPFAPADLAGCVANLARARADADHDADGDNERIVASPRAAELLGSEPGLLLETASPGTRPHDYANVRVAILSGEVGVAESGAVAVSGADTPERSLLVLSRHLILLLPAAGIAADLHRAFAALPDDTLAHHHLTWVCGPSKTADIEQTLVYGAHGPLTTDVVVFRGSPGHDPR